MPCQGPLGEQPVIHGFSHNVCQPGVLLVLAKPEGDHRRTRRYVVEQSGIGPSALEVLAEWIHVQAAQCFAPGRGEDDKRERAAVLMVGLVLRDQFQVIREREPVDGPPTVAVYADDVRAGHVRRIVQCSRDSGQWLRDESFVMKADWNRRSLVEHDPLSRRMHWTPTVIGSDATRPGLPHSAKRRVLRPRADHDGSSPGLKANALRADERAPCSVTFLRAPRC
jgi:hypothetical protein